MPNTFAYIALIIWPFISLLFYKRMPIINATFWTIVGGFLLLPVRVDIDFPLIPSLDKESIPAIAALIGCIFIKKVKISLIPKTGMERWLVLILLIIPFFSMLNNQESINFHSGLTLHDTFSSIVNQYLKLLPLILGLQLIKTREDQLVLFKLLAIAGLFYSIPILYELRMSPQLHRNFYGYFPHSFAQHVREGGSYRAAVFLGHGLLVSMFIATAFMASGVLLKEKIKTFNFSPWVVFIYLFFLLILCKSLGAILLGLIFLMAFVFMPNTIIKKLSISLTVVVILYPLLSIFDYFPHDKLVEVATDFNSTRGGSLAFRFNQEKLLLEHAEKKLFFGWGGWGRNRLENSITDGKWIIIFGVSGIIGFVSLFSLLLLSVWKAIKVSVLLKNKNEQKTLLLFALMISILMVDQLPNDSLWSWMLFFIGGLLGRSNYIRLKVQHNTIKKNSRI